MHLYPTDIKSGETGTSVINFLDDDDNDNDNDNNNNNKFKITSTKRDPTVMRSFRLTFTKDVAA